MTVVTFPPPLAKRNMDVFVAAILGLLILVLTAMFFNKSKGTSQSDRNNKPKGPEEIPGWSKPPTDPQTGDLGLALSQGSMSLYLQKLHQGGRCPVVALWWGKGQAVSVCGRKAFRETENLYNRPGLVFAGASNPIHGPKSIQIVNDSEWEERKRIVHGTLRGKNVKEGFNELVTVAEETVNKWRPGEKISLMKEMFQMTGKGILAVVFGNAPNGDSICEKMTGLYDYCKCEADSGILSPGHVKGPKFKENLKQLHGFMQQIRENYKKRENGKSQPALLEALESSGLPEEVIISDMVTIFGGFHTNSYYLTWLLYFLAQHPQVQRKLHQDVCNRVNDTSGESLQDYVSTSTSYLRQVVDEGFRLSSTAPYTGHYCNDDLMVEGYLIPAKTPIIHCMEATLRDGEIWEKPEVFDPDRFAPGTEAAKRGREFRPFGVSNLRRCPANQLTYLMVSVFVAVLVQRWFLLGPEEDGGSTPEKKYGIATAPKQDIKIQVKSIL